MISGEKWVFSDADFERMTWHDVTIHAIGFHSQSHETLFDVDYIFEWVDPKEGNHFGFRIAPATLVFENVHALHIDVSPVGHLSIDQIVRIDPRSPRNSEFIEKKQEWTWKLDLHQGEISLLSVGFQMFIRPTPILAQSQVLDLSLRGGLSFVLGRRTRDEEPSREGHWQKFPIK